MKRRIKEDENEGEKKRVKERDIRLLRPLKTPEGREERLLEKSSIEE